MEQSLRVFFDQHPAAFDVWFDTTQTPRISMRLCEFFFMTYLQIHGVTWPIGHKMHSPRLSYMQSLDTLGKSAFDPFCRTSISRGVVYRGHSTTIAQMNFFRYMHQTRATIYIRAYYADIFNTMRTLTRQMRSQQVKKKKKKKKMASSTTACALLGARLPPPVSLHRLRSAYRI